MNPIFFFVLVAIVIAPVWLIGRWILGPIDRAAKHRPAPVRFSIGDFLCLFIVLQLPLAAIHAFVAGGDPGFFWLFTALTWILAPVIWFACARALSKAGVEATADRFVFMGLILPAAYYFIIPFSLMPWIMLWRIFAKPLLDDSLPVFWPTQWLALIWLAMGALLFFCGRATRAIAARASATCGSAQFVELAAES